MTIEFELNGRKVRLSSEPLTRLLDILRETLGQKGTKEGCGEGECGACSVFINGELANSCLVPAAQVQGSRVETIESVRESEGGRVITAAFAEAHAVQCGFCTPGMVMAVMALLRADPDPDEAAIREAISGNICRCTGYDMIVDGVLLAARRGREAEVRW